MANGRAVLECMVREGLPEEVTFQLQDKGAFSSSLTQRRCTHPQGDADGPRKSAQLIKHCNQKGTNY